MIKYDPVSEVDKMMISSAYLKVMSPNGIVKRISNVTNDQTEWTLEIELKIVLTSAPRINPKTKLNLNFTCTDEKYRQVDQSGQPICR